MGTKAKGEKGLIGLLIFCVVAVGFVIFQQKPQVIKFSQAIEGDILLINDGGFGIMVNPVDSGDEADYKRNKLADFIPGSLFEVLDSETEWGEVWKYGTAFDQSGKAYAKGWVGSTGIMNAVIETESPTRK